MLELVKERLANLKIPFSNEPTSTDVSLLNFAIEKITFQILARTNVKAVPEELLIVAIDMVVGEYLFNKYSMGLIDLTTFNFEAIVKQVKDGDTDVSYAVNDKFSPESRFAIFIETLRHGGVKWSDYKVLKW